MDGVADYVFIDEIGSGNHGRFFRAAPPQRLGLADDIIAVKVLDRQASEADFARIATELRALHAVKSSHVVTILDAGSDNGLLFYATPFYEEGSLESPSRALARNDHLRIVADAARGAHDLHEAGVVHRDIKPANILISQDRGLLADLGLARFLAPGMTSAGIGPIGSIEYMSPDTILGEKATRATDLWALGVTLHHVLTGEGIYGPIPDTNVMEAFTYVLKTPPVLSASLDEGDRDIVARCLGMADPFSTSADLADAIEGRMP